MEFSRFILIISLSLFIRGSHQSFLTNCTSPRECIENEPQTCHFRFILETYTTLGGACDQNVTSQCVLADGFEKGILTANRMYPGPTIEVCENDLVVVDVENRMHGMDTTIHWHGVWQRESQYYDGVPFVTQCPIHEGSTFRYQFVPNAGTHFWHSHNGLQKQDGIQGPIIVRQPRSKDSNAALYDVDEHVIFLSDWLHEPAQQRFPGRRKFGVLGQEPDSILINGKGQTIDPSSNKMTTTPLEVFKVSRGQRHRFRMINAFCTECPASIAIEGHNLTVIATDGLSVEPVTVDTINSFSGERFDFVITADQPGNEFWIQVKGLGECGEDKLQQLAVLRYEDSERDPSTPAPSYEGGLPQEKVLNPLEVNCEPSQSNAVCVSHLRDDSADETLLKAEPDEKIFIPFGFYSYDIRELFQEGVYEPFYVDPEKGHIVALVHNISYVAPTSPIISQFNEIDPKIF